MLALRRRTHSLRKKSPKSRVLSGPTRYWDPHRAKRVSKLSPGQSYISTTDELLVSVVGRTVIVSIRDPEAGVVAMTNLVVPTHGLPILEESARTSAHQYAEQLLADLYRSLLKEGAQPGSLEVTLVGGMNTDAESHNPIDETMELCRRFFGGLGIQIVGEFSGSAQAKKVYTTLQDLCPHVMVLDDISSTVGIREQRYTQQLQLQHLLGTRKTHMKFS